MFIIHVILVLQVFKKGFKEFTRMQFLEFLKKQSRIFSGFLKRFATKSKNFKNGLKAAMIHIYSVIKFPFIRRYFWWPLTRDTRPKSTMNWCLQIVIVCSSVVCNCNQKRSLFPIRSIVCMAVQRKIMENLSPKPASSCQTVSNLFSPIPFFQMRIID